MQPYDKNALLRLVHEVPPLGLMYADFSEQLNNDYDKALWETYVTGVLPFEDRKERYDQLWWEVKGSKLFIVNQTDNTLRGHIRQLINQYGWRAFRDELVALANQKMTQFQLLRLTRQVDEWRKVRDTLEKVRKNVQL